MINVCWNDVGVLDGDGLCMFDLTIADGFPVALPWVLLFRSVRNEILQSPNPREWEREFHHFVNLHREILPQRLLNCVKLKFVSCRSNLLEQMYDFQKGTMVLQKWILNPQDLPQNRSLEKS